MAVAHGWELAVAAPGAGLIVIVFAALTGLAVAAELFGGGWVWPHGTHAITRTVSGILAGHPGRGLAAADAARIATAWATYLCITLCELLLISAAIAGGRMIARHLRDNGMATRRDAERALGVDELRSARTIIRPDLYGPNLNVDPAGGDVADAGVYRRGIGLAISHLIAPHRKWNWRWLRRSKET